MAGEGVVLCCRRERTRQKGREASDRFRGQCRESPGCQAACLHLLVQAMESQCGSLSKAVTRNESCHWWAHRRWTSYVKPEARKSSRTLLE